MKKDENRFTIRFNSADPRHQRTMEALEAAGRRKAFFIADAVCEYLARHGGRGAADTILPALPPAVASIHVPPEYELPLKILETEAGDFSEDTVLDDDMRDAVLDGLSAFMT